VTRPLRIAVLVKQIPLVEEMRLGSDGRLVRAGAALEMNAFCRRAVSKAVDLAAESRTGSVTIFTLGPASAEDVLREAISWGRARAVDTRGVLVSDSAFAGSDTIATARALSAALARVGSFDLVLTGKNSLDADTGQVPPQVAQFLGLPFACGVKELIIEGDLLRLHCEHDDAGVDLEVSMPAVLSCAERLCEPAKVNPEGRAAVPAEVITTVTAADLGPGSWGAAGSLTSVGGTREIVIERQRQIVPGEAVATQIAKAVEFLVEAGALWPGAPATVAAVPTTGGPGPVVAVLSEPGHQQLALELCGLAARLAAPAGGSTVLLAPHEVDLAAAGSWGADRVIRIVGSVVEEDIARGVAEWAAATAPWGLLTGSTAFGREIASRVAVAISAGLTGDAVDAEVDCGSLVAWKPAFGGALVAAIHATSATHLVTVRAGVHAIRAPREHIATLDLPITVQPRGRIRVIRHQVEDSLAGLAMADVVVGIGSAVGPDELAAFDDLIGVLGAEVACTRKLTDAGRMPHARQIGITGRSIAPRLYIAVGISGKFNHMSGVRAAGTVLAVNNDPDAPIWQFADVGIVGDWRECIPALTDAFRATLTKA
jgi:electron transfer flavoprotein alpha subunit